MEQDQQESPKEEKETIHDELDRAEPEKRAPLFEDLAYDNSFTELESLCMNCGENGVTRLLLTKVPFFKEVILMAFSCPHCGYRSNEVQYGGSIAEKGIRIELKVTNIKDVNRQIVKADSATLTVPELEFEIPANTQKGLLNTIEGFLSQSAEGLSENQDERRAVDPETTAKIDTFIEKLYKCARAEIPFTIIIDDPAGNSFIENLYAPASDPNMKISHYKRTAEQNFAIGLNIEEAPEDIAYAEYEKSKKEGKNEVDLEKFDYKNEVMNFPGNCYACHAPCQTRMVVVDVPYFKEVVIMASACDNCGYKSNEVKAGGEIPAKGRRIQLAVTDVEDLSRNVLKSETATVTIPEFQIVVGQGTLGGRFTTLEGLLVGIRDDIAVNPFFSGDSGEEEKREKVKKFFKNLDRMIAGEEKFTLILEDPVANSYVQNPYAPDSDPNMTVEDFERSFEQNEELGLNDIKTENY